MRGNELETPAGNTASARRLSYNWEAKYGGMEASDLRRMKHLEHENARLKRMYADLSLTHEATKDFIKKGW